VVFEAQVALARGLVQMPEEERQVDDHHLVKKHRGETPRQQGLKPAPGLLAGRLPGPQQADGLCLDAEQAAGKQMTVSTKQHGLLFWVFRYALLGAIVAPLLTWWIGVRSGWITWDIIIFGGIPLGVVGGGAVGAAGWLASRLLPLLGVRDRTL
jgi:hypothetical protein